MSLTDDLRALADRGGPAADPVRAVLDQPLRVAIVGRVNAGKSTLLNALVGDRLAATDATERTLVPTWYRHGTRYRVSAHLVDGSIVEVAHDRGPDGLVVGTDGLDITRLDVEWPASVLETMTLIDTPGLDGRAGEFDMETDAVLVLMRHRHARDAAFLESFTRSRAGAPTSASAIVVVSRADEMGDGGSDALEVAGRAAKRIAADARIGLLCGDVLAVAGLLAEAAATLTEADGGVLSAVASLSTQDRAHALSSVDRFRSVAVGVSASDRHELLVRLGMAGVRIAVDALAAQPDLGASGVADLLAQRSGIHALREVITERFTSRAEALRAGSAMALLRDLPGLAGDVERLEAGADEFVSLRLAGLLAAGLPGLPGDDLGALQRLAGTGTPAERLGVDHVDPAAAAAVVARWRAVETDPMADADVLEAARLAARLAEGIHAGLV